MKRSGSASRSRIGGVVTRGRSVCDASPCAQHRIGLLLGSIHVGAGIGGAALCSLSPRLVKAVKEALVAKVMVNVHVA